MNGVEIPNGPVKGFVVAACLSAPFWLAVWLVFK